MSRETIGLVIDVSRCINNRRWQCTGSLWIKVEACLDVEGDLRVEGGLLCSLGGRVGGGASLFSQFGQAKKEKGTPAG